MNIKLSNCYINMDNGTRDINVLIVDDHTIFREGLASMLDGSEGINIVGSVSEGRQALDLLASREVDVVVTDLTMEGMNGQSLCQELAVRYPDIYILVLTMHDDLDHINTLIKSGISGYVLKNIDKQDLISAIKTVNAGEAYFSEKVKTAVMGSMIKKKTKSEPSKKLTAREIEIILLITQEIVNQDIADKLFISINTVETHRRNIMRKLEVHNSVGLYKKAVEMGLITEESKSS